MKEKFVVGSLTVTKYTVDSFLCNMYVITTEKSLSLGSALVIDAIQSDEALADLNAVGIGNLTVILTHEHFDHTTGINWLRENFHVHLISHELCGQKIRQPRYNRSLSIMGMDADSQKYKHYPPYVCEVDEVFSVDTCMDWCGMEVKLICTPGHTAASCCIGLAQCMFVGDSALPGQPTLTRLPSGSQKDFDEITLPILKAMSQDTTIFPGHGDVYQIGEMVYREDCFQWISELKGEQENGLS